MTKGCPLRVGDRVPDVTLLTSAGEETDLRAWRGEAMLLIFLRHLG
jgi:peroxiredoxin